MILSPADAVGLLVVVFSSRRWPLAAISRLLSDANVGRRCRCCCCGWWKSRRPLVMGGRYLCLRSSRTGRLRSVSETLRAGIAAAAVANRRRYTHPLCLFSLACTQTHSRETLSSASERLFSLAWRLNSIAARKETLRPSGSSIRRSPPLDGPRLSESIRWFIHSFVRSFVRSFIGRPASTNDSGGRVNWTLN